MFDHESDSIRELSYVVFQNILEKDGLKMDTQTLLLSVILNRVKSIPYQETSEEVRLIIVKTIINFLGKYPDVFKKDISNVAQFSSSILKDKYHEIKKEASVFIT